MAASATSIGEPPLARRERVVMFASAFGRGDAFLAAWHRWRADPARSERLVFIAIAPPGFDRARLAQQRRDAPATAPGDLAGALLAAWPVAAPGLHRLTFDDAAVELLVAFGDLATWLRRLVADVDHLHLDGAAFGDAPLEERAVARGLARLAVIGARLRCAGLTTAMRHQLTSAGFVFDVDGVDGVDDVGDVTDVDAATVAHVDHARFAPRRAAERAPVRHRAGGSGERHALIVGAGLAGCAAACALAEHGWRSTLVERHDRIAAEASGNAAGLFHGIVNGIDGAHARFNRAAALAAAAAVRDAIGRGVAGSAGGLLRLEASRGVAQMNELLRRLDLPPDYVQALDAAAASEHAGIALASPAWLYPSGGWVAPAGLARAFLDRAGAHATVHAATEVHALRDDAPGWTLLDVHGEAIASAATVVLANAGDALRLIDAVDWPVQRLRGQLSSAPAGRIALPRVPVTGAGYLLPAIDGRMFFGATAQRDDADPAVRASDHAHNLAQLARLTGREIGLAPGDLAGRTAWRCSAADRLPMIGAVPDGAAGPGAGGRATAVPRRPGLFILSGLGSRGITWSALGAQLLASWVSGAPSPLEAGLRDAVDPARFGLRCARAAGGGVG